MYLCVYVYIYMYIYLYIYITYTDIPRLLSYPEARKLHLRVSCEAAPGPGAVAGQALPDELAHCVLDEDLRSSIFWTAPR